MPVTVTLTFLNGPLKGKKREFSRPARCVIGRSGECDLQLPSSLEFMDVSRRHCEVHIDPRSLRVRDLGSRNGTFVNGNNIGQRQPGHYAGADEADGWHTLKRGDELRIGDTFLRLEVSAGQDRKPVGQQTGRASAL